MPRSNYISIELYLDRIISLELCLDRVMPRSNYISIELYLDRTIYLHRVIPQSSYTSIELYLDRFISRSNYISVGGISDSIFLETSMVTLFNPSKGSRIMGIGYLRGRLNSTQHFYPRSKNFIRISTLCWNNSHLSVGVQPGRTYILIFIYREFTPRIRIE